MHQVHMSKKNLEERYLSLAQVVRCSSTIFSTRRSRQRRPHLGSGDVPASKNAKHRIALAAVMNTYCAQGRSASMLDGLHYDSFIQQEAS